jgi:hypothetical protein
MSVGSFDDHLLSQELGNDTIGRFLAAVQTQRPVGGLTKKAKGDADSYVTDPMAASANSARQSARKGTWLVGRSKGRK